MGVDQAGASEARATVHNPKWTCTRFHADLAGPLAYAWQRVVTPESTLCLLTYLPRGGAPKRRRSVACELPSHLCFATHILSRMLNEDTKRRITKFTLSCLSYRAQYRAHRSRQQGLSTALPQLTLSSQQATGELEHHVCISEAWGRGARQVSARPLHSPALYQRPCGYNTQRTRTWRPKLRLTSLC